MQKRSCKRFSIPGTTLYYKERSSFFKKTNFPDTYYPVVNLSKGGAQFLCNQRLKVGKELKIKIDIPNQDQVLEIISDVRWIAKNREQSYAYQTGIAFHSYGDKKNENPMEILSTLETLEKQATDVK